MNYVAEVAQRIRREVDPSLLPEGDIDQLFLIYALLAFAKGASVTSKDVHDAWSVWMTQQDPKHNSIEPFAELPAGTRREDQPFVLAIRRVAAELDK